MEPFGWEAFALKDQIESWCSQIPGLHKMADGHWSVPSESSVSFPVNDQAELALIEESSYWFKHRNEAISSIVKRFPPNGPIVDVGGGNGFVSKALMEGGFSTVVVEPGPIAVSVCVERHVPVVHAAFQDLDISPESIHAIGLFDVLEHIEDEVGALRGMQKALKSGGLLFLTVPAYQWLWSMDDADAGHFRRYALGSLRKKMEAAGFAVEYETYLFSPLVIPLFLLRTIPLWFGFRRKVDIERSKKEHSLPRGVVGCVLSRFLEQERQKVGSGYGVRFGTSCLMVARRQ